MKGTTNGIIHRVRHLFGRADRTTDAELMARFVADRDADAFALLVRRHGPMVHGVCRRVLRQRRRRRRRLPGHIPHSRPPRPIGAAPATTRQLALRSGVPDRARSEAGRGRTAST